MDRERERWGDEENRDGVMKKITYKEAQEQYINVSQLNFETGRSTAGK
jgi:hypothetical protein